MNKIKSLKTLKSLKGKDHFIQLKTKISYQPDSEEQEIYLLSK